ncbi:hypothetical protein I79_016064 [Cricetulus griseus]|uniref:Uncharacterized protein n=1 Tax=Cricetulus griseus TaxID=10029 RepID=G3HYD9_CRIGR|nr:hypothetical protein I79_016064 [Cricetulus griseus]
MQVSEEQKQSQGAGYGEFEEQECRARQATGMKAEQCCGMAWWEGDSSWSRHWPVGEAR